MWGSRASEIAARAHFETHTPQPMHAPQSTTALISLWGEAAREIALNWQNSTHVPQPLQRSESTWLTYPEEANMGVPFRCAWIAPQQQLQQLQMA